MKDLKSLTLEELKEELKEGGFPAYRAGQLYRWLHVQLAEDPEEMTNLPPSGSRSADFQAGRNAEVSVSAAGR